MRPRFLPVFLAALLAISPAACRRDEAQGADTAAPATRGDVRKDDVVVLRVGQSSYVRSDFEDYLRSIAGDSGENLTPETLSRLFDRFCEDKLLLEAARLKNVVVTDEEKKQSLIKLQGETPAGREDALSPSALERLSERLLIEKYSLSVVRDVSVSDAEVHSYYQAHKSDFLQPERVKVSQILLKSEEKAIDVLSRVQNVSEEEFKAVARLESVGPEAVKSGEMGVFSPGQLPFEIEKVIFGLAESEISQIVESSYGYHIFRLDKRFEPELVTEDKAAASIRVKILDRKIGQALSAHLDELRRSLDWAPTTQNLTFTYQRNWP